MDARDDLSNIVRPSRQDVWDAFNNLFCTVEMVIHKFEEGPGGDHYVYTGSMTAIEDLRETFSEVNDVLNRELAHLPDEPIEDDDDV